MFYIYETGSARHCKCGLHADVGGEEGRLRVETVCHLPTVDRDRDDRGSCPRATAGKGRKAGDRVAFLGKVAGARTRRFLPGTL